MRVCCSIVMFLCVGMLPGCQQEQHDSAISSADQSGPQAMPRQSPEPAGAGVTVSVKSAVRSDVLPDGGILVPDVPPAPLDEIRALLDAISELSSVVDVDQAEEAVSASRRARNLKIVELATNVLRLAMGNESRRAEFQEGIQYLLGARLQLAVDGTEDDVDQLYDDVQAINDRDPQSTLAAEGIYHLAKFAFAKARVLGKEDVVWYENFSRWAREFAGRFPYQKQRAASLLLGAGRSCEMRALDKVTAEDAEVLWAEARRCYSTLVKDFGDTSQGREAKAVLRRIALPGKLLTQFAGPTVSGGYIDAEDFVGRVTVIFFWDSRNVEFREKLLPLLQQANAVSNDRLRFVGVCLDDDESVLKSFLASHDVPGEHVFFREPDQRAWGNPVVRFWGMSKGGCVWLVDRDRRVSSVDVRHDQLVDRMRVLFH